MKLIKIAFLPILVIITLVVFPIISAQAVGFKVCDYRHSESITNPAWPSDFEPMAEYTIGLGERCPLPPGDNNNRIHRFKSVSRTINGNVSFYQAETVNEIDCKVGLKLVIYEDVFVY